MRSPFRFARSFFKKLFPQKQEPETLVFKEIGWKITMPERFRLLPGEEAVAFLKKGMRKLENPAFISSDKPGAKILFTAIFETASLFHGVMTPVNEGVAEEYIRQQKALTKTMLQELHESKYNKHAGAAIQMVDDCIMIGNIEFESIDITISTPGQVLLQSSNYFKQHKGYYITISAVFIADEIGREIFHALLKSKFDE